jgi:hypothetical protein
MHLGAMVVYCFKMNYRKLCSLKQHTCYFSFGRSGIWVWVLWLQAVTRLQFRCHLGMWS